MQRYRINYKLLVGVFVGSVVILVAGFFLQRWQVNRKATWFRDSSAVALKDGDPEEAFELLKKYVQLRRDEQEPRIELANIGLDLLKRPGTPPELQRDAYGVLDDAVRRTDDLQLRRELAKLMMRMSRPQDALVHLDELLRETPNDSELLAMQVQAVYRVKGAKPAIDLSYKLVGYDPATDKFDSTKAIVKDRPEIYSLLVNLILEKDKDKELAERVADQMVEVNPDSAEAYLYRSMSLRTLKDTDDANVALDKAYELDPNNLDVLQQKGEVAFLDKDYEQAEKILVETLEKDPERLGVYKLLAQVHIQQEEMDKALKTLDDGIEKIGLDRSLIFARDKINIYINQQDYAAVEKELVKLSKLDNPALQPFIDFTKAHVVWRKQEWTEAARQLKIVEPLLIDYPQEQSLAGALLAASYERQGKYDLAMQKYAQVLKKHPDYEAAKTSLRSLQERIGVFKDDEAGDLDKAIEDMAKLPAAEQDWDQIEQLVTKIAKEREFTEARVKLVQANVMMKRNKYDEAKELIRQAAALEKDNINISYAAIGLLSTEPETGPSKALALLDMVVKKNGENLRSQAVRAQLLRAINAPDVSEQLDTLATGIDAWTKPEQAEMFATIAGQFELLKQYDKARDYLKRAIELVPDNLQIRKRLFEVAVQERSDEHMLEAEKLILELVKDKSDGDYVYSVVRHMMLNFSQQKVMREELAGARKMLDGVLKRRPEWAELHVLYGQLLLVLEEDQDIALKHLNDALKYGPPNATAVALQVRLLGQRGEMAEARKKLELIPEAMRLQLVGRANAEVLLLTGDKEDAFKSAQELAKIEVNNANTQVWFARVATDAGKLGEAAAALTKATELEPTNSDIWMQLLSLYAGQKDITGIEDTLRKAQLAIEGDHLALLTAKKYELMGDWRAAEKIYLANFAGQLDELPIAQKLAEFYLVWAQAGKTTNAQAAPYLNRIMRQANEGKIDRNNPYALWARDKAARLLAGSGDYQESQKAQRLLGASGDLKSLSQQDKSLLAEILASRSEPQSQLKAISMLSEMDRNGTITREGVLALAKLLSKSGDWDRSRELMLHTITKFGSDEQVRATFINLLIERGDYGTASTQLADLKKVNPNSPSLISLSIKLAAASGNRTRVVTMLKSMIPEKLTGALDEKQLNNMLMVARLAAEHEEYQLAEMLYRHYVSRVPNAITLEFARYMALHGDPDQAIEILKSVFPQSMDDVLRICAEMLRSRREEIGDKYDTQLGEMIAAALRDDPESVQRMLVKAEILETQTKYEDSVAMYDAVLKRDDVPRMMRAAAMNNLGFLLTLLNQRTDEAEKFINQAIEVYGPVDDILDTRAVVRMARKDYDAAVEDMSLATSLSNDPVKFFHFAHANLLAGNDQAALKAWEKAQKLGFKKEKLPVLEQKNFDKIKSDIEGLRTQNAKL